MSSASSFNFNHGFPTPGPQSPSGQRVMDHVFFLSNDAWKQAREERRYDLVVIGTGPCGLAVAHRALKRDPSCRILMIERGTFFLPEHFQNLPLPFVNTLGGLSETFPWTLSDRTAGGSNGTIRWQHGMVPFFGGRSTLWSAWCPRPTREEMQGWPEATVASAESRFQAAEELLHVQRADQVDEWRDESEKAAVRKKRPVYGALQSVVQGLLKEKRAQAPAVYRTEPAPLASRAEPRSGIDFQKFATPAAILQLVLRQRERAAAGGGHPLDVVTDCVVQRIISQGPRATALQTSRGVLPLGNAKLILATGTLPPTTLVQQSFPAVPQAGERFSAHFITSVVARVPRSDLDPDGGFGPLEIAACYVAGKGEDYSQQFHIQLTALADQDPGANSESALRHMPDVVATASKAQLRGSGGHVVFVCAVLGELDYRNPDSWFRPNPADGDPTTASILQVAELSSDRRTWDVMDESTFQVLERILSPKGPGRVEYWHGTPDEGSWSAGRPPVGQRRVDALVHESSTLHLGEDEHSPVRLDYRLRGVENVFVTGGSLWPRGGSWNPTLTMVALAFDLVDQLIASKG